MIYQYTLKWNKTLYIISINIKNEHRQDNYSWNMEATSSSLRP